MKELWGGGAHVKSTERGRVSSLDFSCFRGSNTGTGSHWVTPCPAVCFVSDMFIIVKAVKKWATPPTSWDDLKLKDAFGTVLSKLPGTK